MKSLRLHPETNPQFYRAVRYSFFRGQSYWAFAMIWPALALGWALFYWKTMPDCAGLKDYQCFAEMLSARELRLKTYWAVAAWLVFSSMIVALAGLGSKVKSDSENGTLADLRLGTVSSRSLVLGRLIESMLMPSIFALPFLLYLSISLPYHAGVTIYRFALPVGVISIVAQLTAFIILGGRWDHRTNKRVDELVAIAAAWLFIFAYLSLSDFFYDRSPLMGYKVLSWNLSDSLSVFHLLEFSNRYQYADQTVAIGWMMSHLGAMLGFSLAFLAFAVHVTARKFQDPDASILTRKGVWGLGIVVSAYGALHVCENTQHPTRLSIFAIFVIGWILVLPALLTPNAYVRWRSAQRRFSLWERLTEGAAPVALPFFLLSALACLATLGVYVGWYGVFSPRGAEWTVRIFGGLLFFALLHRWCVGRFENARSVYLACATLLAAASGLYYTLQAALENRGWALWPILPPFNFFQVSVTTTPSKVLQPFHLPIYLIEIALMAYLYFKSRSKPTNG